MSKVIRLTRGYDIPIAGKAGKKVVPGFTSRTYSVKPTDFHGLAPIPKLLVSEQAEVKAGDPLFYDKSNEAIKYCAPVSGEVVEIRRGDKRAIEEVVILADSETKYRDFGRHDIGSLGREQIVSTMMCLPIRKRSLAIYSSQDLILPRWLPISTSSWKEGDLISRKGLLS